MIGTLQWLSRHATLVLMLSVFAALAVPGMATLLYPLITPAVWGVIFLSVLRLDPERLAHHAGRPGVLLAAVAWVAAGATLAAWAAGTGLMAGFGLSPELAVAMVLSASAPPLLSSPAVALMVGLDAALVMAVVTLATLVMPVVSPPLIAELLGLATGIDTLTLMLRLAVLIASATAAALVVRRIAGSRRVAAWSPVTGGLTVVFLVFFAIAMMNGVTPRLLAEPGYVLGVVALAVALNVGLQATGALLFAGLGRRSALSVAYPSGNRAIGIWIAVMPGAIHPDVFLFIAAAQVPIFMLPDAMRRLYGRLLPDVVG